MPCLVEIRRRKGVKTRFSYGIFPLFERKQDGKFAFHWERRGVPDEEAEDIKVVAENLGFACRVIPEGQARSHDYRRRFIAADPGPWRCRYCNRRLEGEKNLTVDHVIPVAAVSRGPSWRRGFWMSQLRKKGAETVNDRANLVPACRACNSAKGSKTGLWVLRARLGAHPAYWVALRVSAVVAIVLAAAAVFILIGRLIP